MYADQTPKEIDDLKREISQLETEKALIKIEEGKSSYRLEALDQAIEEKNKIYQEKLAAYKKEKSRQEDLIKEKIALEDIDKQIAQAKAADDYEKLDNLLLGKKSLEMEIKNLETQGPFYKIANQVTVDQVRDLVETLSGMPQKTTAYNLEYFESLRKDLKEKTTGLAANKIIEDYLLTEISILTIETGPEDLIKVHGTFDKQIKVIEK